MKHLWAVCLLAAIPVYVGGQSKPAAKSDSASVEQTLVQMERDWTQANLKKDTAALDRILADDWVAVDHEGKASTKAQALADLKSGASATQSVDLGEMKVRVLGNTAFVTGSDTEKSAFKGKDTSGKYYWTDVFMQRNGRWQAVASQSAKVAK
jgi:ketosteroid isomerase-like protein